MSGSNAPSFRFRLRIDAINREWKKLPGIPFVVGALLGFIACCYAGRIVSDRGMFRPFSRFFLPIQPQTLFYPTASELVSYVHRTVSKDKVLVLVGGASYFRGFGQNPDEVWTLELQRLLGKDYGVVNFAVDQGGMTDFAGAVFQILAREYSRIIYVSNGAPFGNGNDGIDGNETYRYVFWDAYYKGRFQPDAVWMANVKKRAAAERSAPAGFEMHLGKWIDSKTYACDLWTYVGYRYFFTVWSSGTGRWLLRARGLFKERPDPNLPRYQSEARANKDYINPLEAANKSYVQNSVVRGKNGELEPLVDIWTLISNSYRDLFPEALRTKCLVVLLHPNHYFAKSLNEDDWQRYRWIYKKGQETIERQGYQVVQAGEDFTPDDYIDGGHFMASGGRKIAAIVAVRIRERFEGNK